MEEQVGSDQAIIETIDESQLRVSPKRLCLSLVLLALTIVPWLSMYDLLREPKDIQAIRKRFCELQASYLSRAEHWSDQKAQVLDLLYTGNKPFANPQPTQAFTDIPLEVVMAYLTEDLGLGRQAHPRLAWYPLSDEDSSHLILSREDRSWGPLKTVVSVELSLIKNKQGYDTEIHRLRRGSREISADHAWKYFHRELAHLSSAKPLLSGILDLHFFEREVSPESKEAGGYVSWTTRPRSIPPALEAYTRSSSLNR